MAMCSDSVFEVETDFDLGDGRRVNDLIGHFDGRY